MTRSPATWYVGTASGNGSRCPGPANASPTIPPGWQPGDKIVYVDEHNWLRSLAWYALGIGLSVLVAWLCFGCAAPQQSPQPQSSTVSSNQWNEGLLLNKVEAPAFPVAPSVVAGHSLAGYETNFTPYCASVMLTNRTPPLLVGPFCQYPKTSVTISAPADGYLEWAPTALGPFQTYSIFDWSLSVPVAFAQSAVFRLRQNLVVLLNYGSASDTYTNTVASTNNQANIKTVPGAKYYAAACLLDDLGRIGLLSVQVAWTATGTNTVLAWDTPPKPLLTIR